jgi:hypothetical protein
MDVGTSRASRRVVTVQNIAATFALRDVAPYPDDFFYGVQHDGTQ